MKLRIAIYTLLLAILCVGCGGRTSMRELEQEKLPRCYVLVLLGVLAQAHIYKKQPDLAHEILAKLLQYRDEMDTLSLGTVIFELATKSDRNVLERQCKDCC